MVSEETQSVTSVRVCTVQGVQGVVQLVRVAADASQSLFGVGFSDVDSVQQLVELLQRGTE